MSEKETAELIGRTANTALIIAGLLENELSKDHWHADLLERMTIRIEGVRIPAVSESNQAHPVMLSDLERFLAFLRSIWTSDT